MTTQFARIRRHPVKAHARVLTGEPVTDGDRFEVLP
ncbi:MAG: hypothetical protein HLUCCO07_04780 [Rhodobacteraceae bacterium HLUCCO07]|nr:MAG: hypothetical protein HLUCCO07_04780 [Rhodobacteraceae bacterium HLUCCO07]